MQYRRFGKLDVSVSLLGFGTMRLPIVSQESTQQDNKAIDRPEAIRMIRHAIDQGVNYVDTAWPYHGGESELLTGEALRDGYRERVFLATKNPTWLLKTADEWDHYLDRQLERLGTDHIDFYLQHNFDRSEWEKFQELNLWERAMKAKAAGKIKYFGFSFHDEHALFCEILDAHDWDFCQIQLNYVDTEYQAGLAGLQKAAAKDIGVIIMEPLRGGRLTTRLPAEIAARLAAHPSHRSPAEWSFDWLANQPGIATILSGMTTFAQVEDNLRIFSAPGAVVGGMKPDELALLEDIGAEWRRMALVGCTGCDYCMPCPKGVNIPGIFATYNAGRSAAPGAHEQAMRTYADEYVAKGIDATKCAGCRLCERSCPQWLPISRRLKELDASLRGKA